MSNAFSGHFVGNSFIADVGNVYYTSVLYVDVTKYVQMTRPNDKLYVNHVAKRLDLYFMEILAFRKVVPLNMWPFSVLGYKCIIPRSPKSYFSPS